MKQILIFEWMDREQKHQKESFVVEIDDKDLEKAEKVKQMLYSVVELKRPCCFMTRFSALNAEVSQEEIAELDKLNKKEKLS